MKVSWQRPRIDEQDDVVFTNNINDIVHDPEIGISGIEDGWWLHNGL